MTRTSLKCAAISLLLATANVRADWVADFAKAVGLPGCLETSYLDTRSLPASNVVWCTTMNDSNRTFSPVTIAVFTRGSFLASNRVQALDCSIERLQAERERRQRATSAAEALYGTNAVIVHRARFPLMRRIQIEDGRNGHILPLGFAVDSSIAVLPSSDNRYDIYVASKTLDADKDPTPPEAVQLYRDRLKDQPFQVLWDMVLTVDHLLATGV